MRLGLFGGTFDPIHLGHLLLAEQCREQCSLDEVWFLPSGTPPHKMRREITPGKVRAEMIELAISGHSPFRVCRDEIERDEVSYTFQTLHRLRDADPSRELYFLIGADSLWDLPTWREPAQVLHLATVVAVNRGGMPLPEIPDITLRLNGADASRIMVIGMPDVQISSSDIRSRVREGKSIRYMTPRAVEMYIAQHGLYRGA